MTTIKTTAPIAIEDLKQYFVDKTINYVIDYTGSTLKGAKLLTYLSNLDLPCDIEFTTKEEELELLKEYLNTPLLVNISSLEDLVLDVLLHAKGLEDYGLEVFVEENKDVILSWLSKIDSLTLFNLYSIDGATFKEYVNSFPLDETDSLQGVNFISLIKNPRMYSLYGIISNDSLKFYKTYFEKYMFKGKNLYNFWATENNPMFLLTWGIANGTVQGQTIQETENAGSA